jgi:hypothetical protein
LAPEYQRCGIYLALGWFLAVGMCIGLKVADLNPKTWVELSVVLPAFSVPILGIALLTWRQALRVDDRGLWRRRFFRWDLWPWEAFAGGAVREGTSQDSWVYPAKPWHRRYLFLEFLAEGDRSALAERIREVWKRPATVLPDAIEIRYGLGKRLEFSSQGIVLSRRKRERNCYYAWSEVLRLRVTKTEQSRRDFQTLELDLAPGARPIQLHYRQGNRSWTGPDAETLLAYVLLYVPADRLEITALTGWPQTRDEAYRRLEILDRSERDLRNVSRFVTALMFGGCLVYLFMVVEVHSGSFLDWDWVQWLAAGCMAFSLAITGVVSWVTLAEAWRRLRTQRSELMDWAAGEQAKAP